MHFPDSFKIYFSLAKQSNIGEQDASIFDLRLTALLIHGDPITPFDKIISTVEIVLKS